MSTYVLVHGAWHTGDLLESVANSMRTDGHVVYTPTLAGNRPGDKKNVGLDEAITSLVNYFEDHQITDAVLLGHSYGGMVITGAADRLPVGSVRRLIYWSAFVPNDGESLEDLAPPTYRDLFDEIEQPDGSVLLPFPLWHGSFINDADQELAQETYEMLNPHPHKTMQDKIRLRTNPEDMPIAKSFLHCSDDIAMPESAPWHPRLSNKLGAFRFVSMPGSHEVCFTHPALLAAKIIASGED